MKQLNRRVILWSGLLLAVILSLTGLQAAQAGRSRNVAAAPLTCDVVVSPGESIQSAIDANYLTICVRGGVYQEAIRIASSKPGRTLIAYGDGAPIIDGNKRLPGSLPAQQYLALVELQAAETTFDGFEVRFSSTRGIDVTADHVTIRNTSVHDSWSSGIIVFGGATPLTNVLVENNVISNNLRKVEHVPVIVRGLRTGSDEIGWTFDPDVTWDAPFWSGITADLPESSLNGLSLTFNDDPTTNRIYVGSLRTSATRPGMIGAQDSATGQLIAYSGNDILFQSPHNNKWTLYFNGEDFQLPAGKVIDAFQIENVPPETLPCASCAPMLMSFAETVTLTMEGIVTPTVVGPDDIVRFSPTATDPQWGHITAGGFSLYNTAAGIGLPAGANIDTLGRAPDGRLLARYTKNRPFSLGGEDLVHQAGMGVTVSSR